MLNDSTYKLCDITQQSNNDTSQCIEFKGSKNKDGYGLVSFKGSRVFAHRKAYEDTYGKIPSGLIIRHTCDNPCCINPKHLILGTHADNNHDKVIRDRCAKGESHGRSKLTKKDVIFIKNNPKISSHYLAKNYFEYRITKRAIDLIRTGKTWRSLN